MQEAKPGRTRAQPAKECQDFCEQAVHVSELKNWHCEVLGFQMSTRLSQGFLRLTEASCFVNLHFSVFGSSEKDDPCNERLFRALS